MPLKWSHNNNSSVTRGKGEENSLHYYFHLNLQQKSRGWPPRNYCSELLIITNIVKLNCSMISGVNERQQQLSSSSTIKTSSQQQSKGTRGAHLGASCIIFWEMSVDILPTIVWLSSKELSYWQLPPFSWHQFANLLPLPDNPTIRRWLHVSAAKYVTPGDASQAA